MSSSKKQITIDFLRHGEPVGGDVLRGRVDHPLSELGWSQMQKAAALCSERKVTPSTPSWTHLISSPLQRCRVFAEHLAGVTALELQVAQQWQEIDYGDWDGMLLSDWRKEAGPQFKEFRNDVSKLHPPNGEAFLSFRDRVLTAWNGLADLADGSHVLVVTHGGVLRVVLPTVLGMPLNRSYPLHIPFASFSRIALSVDLYASATSEEESGKERGGSDQKISASLLFHNAAEYEGLVTN
ncbi:MAG: histidine phosphatase family protein [Gammaproteobacteria bacterium]|nr:histidine phosphatase family protein [Gammaproteobacteria bacterium]